jgi:uncharacterized protein YjlB
MKEPKQYLLEDNGTFPNNHLPALHYKQVFNLSWFLPGIFVRRVFKRNGWGNNWRAGIFTYSHYHSNTHEVLGVIKGEATLLLGGKGGREIHIRKGDVLVIPAGVAHQNLSAEIDLTCIGGYPGGRDYDMNYGEPGERPITDKNIASVPLPSRDPVYGINAPLRNIWKSVRS